MTDELRVMSELLLKARAEGGVRAARTILDLMDAAERSAAQQAKLDQIRAAIRAAEEQQREIDLYFAELDGTSPEEIAARRRAELDLIEETPMISAGVLLGAIQT